MRYLRQNTAVNVSVGPFVDWADGKTLLRLNDDFDPADLTCELVKGSTGATLTLTKTGGNNNINLSGNGLAVMALTAGNTDTAGTLRLFFSNAIVDGFGTDTILPFTEDFSVLPAAVYDSLFADNQAISKFDGDLSAMASAVSIEALADQIDLIPTVPGKVSIN